MLGSGRVLNWIFELERKRGLGFFVRYLQHVRFLEIPLLFFVIPETLTKKQRKDISST